ncbi:LysE family translocator [uncultured Sphaerochaeta sp.]|uniref:LysE family translocator n=1 Tax=uncultured Sphaerochaeta sp. TaxID=886478 RepID=UPI0029C9B350|nr:LysE family translocator [uncultured Sphaerochaeta sp.]
MEIDYVSVFIFTFVTTYTPGPNTISSAMMGVQVGYRRSIPYFLGIATGFFTIMLLGGIFASLLARVLPEVMKVFSYVGAAYILYLAYRVLYADYALSQNRAKLLGYKDGLLLQLFNPKVLVLALTIYTTFLGTIDRSVSALMVSALFLTAMSFSAISLWASFGAAFSHLLTSQKTRRLINGLLALLLVYSAITLVVA